jgi:hypothetical protein
MGWLFFYRKQSLKNSHYLILSGHFDQTSVQLSSKTRSVYSFIYFLSFLSQTLIILLSIDFFKPSFIYRRSQCRAVWGVNCLRSFEPGRWIESGNLMSLKVIHHRQNPIVTNWFRGFTSHSRHGCLCLLSVCVVLWLGSDLEKGWSPFQEILWNVYKIKKLKEAARTQTGL